MRTHFVCGLVNFKKSEVLYGIVLDTVVKICTNIILLALLFSYNLHSVSTVSVYSNCVYLKFTSPLKSIVFLFYIFCQLYIVYLFSIIFLPLFCQRQNFGELTLKTCWVSIHKYSIFLHFCRSLIPFITVLASSISILYMEC